MTPELAAIDAGPDPVFRNTFVCFRLAIAEDARVFGDWLDALLAEAHVQLCEYPNRPTLRAVALDLLHLERFVAAERLDLEKAQRQLRSFARLIHRAIGQNLRPPGQTPAFRETFLALLPEPPQRAARSLGVFLQSSLAEVKPAAYAHPAREAVAGELAFLAARLGELLDEADLYHDQGNVEDERLARFAGHMADRLMRLAETVRGERGLQAAAVALVSEPAERRGLREESVDVE